MESKQPYLRTVIDLSIAQVVNIKNSANNVDWPFRSFKVIDASHNDFICDLQLNVGTDTGDGIKLSRFSAKNFPEAQDSATFIFPAQTGKTITIEFSIYANAEGDQAGLDITGDVFLDGGSSYTNEIIDVTTSTQTLINADDTRIKMYYTHVSGSIAYAGNTADCNDSDYKNLCDNINPGGKYKELHRSGVAFKVESGTAKIKIKKVFK